MMPGGTRSCFLGEMRVGRCFSMTHGSTLVIEYLEIRQFENNERLNVTKRTPADSATPWRNQRAVAF